MTRVPAYRTETRVRVTLNSGTYFGVVVHTWYDKMQGQLYTVALDDHPRLKQTTLRHGQITPVDAP